MSEYKLLLMVIGVVFVLCIATFFISIARKNLNLFIFSVALFLLGSGITCYIYLKYGARHVGVETSVSF